MSYKSKGRSIWLVAIVVAFIITIIGLIALLYARNSTATKENDLLENTVEEMETQLTIGQATTLNTSTVQPLGATEYNNFSHPIP